MQFTAQELKDKLLRALDADSNVRILLKYPRKMKIYCETQNFTFLMPILQNLVHFHPKFSGFWVELGYQNLAPNIFDGVHYSYGDNS